jgi:hypothetical protein
MKKPRIFICVALLVIWQVVAVSHVHDSKRSAQQQSNTNTNSAVDEKQGAPKRKADSFKTAQTLLDKKGLPFDMEALTAPDWRENLAQTYVTSGSYFATARKIREAMERGVSAIGENMSVGYLPGDDAVPSREDVQKAKVAAAVSCAAPFTTDDVVVIGWVNSNAIDLPSGANLGLVVDLNVTETCLATLFFWSQGVAVDLFSNADRAYANAFLVKNSGNAEPPNSSINPTAIQLGGDFRLFNRFKVQFSVFNGQITNPQYLQSVSQVGSTPNPCNRLLPSPSGQVHPFNGAGGVVFGRTVYQLTEGRIGSTGQDVSRTINGRTVPWIWSVIKFNALGEIITSDNAIYFPTYYVYKNGQLIQIYPQSPLSIFVQKDESWQRYPWEIQ